MMFKVDVGVGNTGNGDIMPVRAVVDTGADHAMMPAQLLEQLSVEPLERARFVLADGSRAEYGVGIARFAINNRERPCPVVFGPDNRYLIGASTLEIFNLTVDAAGERLLPEEWLSLGRGGRDDSELEGESTQIFPTEVAAGKGYCIRLRYSDGVAGEVDLSGLAGRGVFAAWGDRAVFESVRLNDHGAIVWDDGLELCPDALYLQLTGKTPTAVMPGLQA